MRPLSILLFTAGMMLSQEAEAQQEAYESPGGTRFLLYTPPGYTSTSTNFPLLISLHSKGEVGDDLTKLTSGNREQMPSRLIYLNRWPTNLPFIVLTPQLKPDPNDPEIQWSAEYIDEVVNYVIDNFRVDLNRIYVTGISRGGTGTWTYASAFPEKVAALLPISGRSDLSQACPIKDIPIWAFHGDNDEVAPPSYSIDMINAIRACQPALFNPRLNILHARNHNGWNEIYNGSAGYKVFDWLLMFRKDDSSNKLPYVNVGRDLKIRLRSEPFYLIADYFDSDGHITNIEWKQISGSALTFDDAGQVLKLSALKAGSFRFKLTVTDNKGGQSSDELVLEIIDSPANPEVSGLLLINGKTDTEVATLSEGQVINKAALGLSEINVKAITSDGTASVIFSVNTDQNTRTQNAGPYYIKNQTPGPEWKVSNGTYLICATPYPQSYGRGTPGVSQCYQITFTETGSDQCANIGKITREVWTEIPGTTVSSIPLNTPPATVGELAVFQSPVNAGNNFGARVRGYICPPSSGNYTFWISGDDHTELWLSTSDNASDKQLIAYEKGWTAVGQWTKYASQQSAPIALVANQKYYIEALHKEASGGDHVAVGWQLPDGTLERPVPGMRLMPFNGSAAPSVSITNPENGETFTAPASIDISADASDDDGSITKVEFYNGTTKLGEDVTAPWFFTWHNVPPGDYMLVVKAISDDGATASSSVEVTVSGEGACESTGSITREVWTGVSGTTVSSIPVLQPPGYTEELASFEGPVNAGDHYGARFRGYLCPPVSGNYVFWIAGDDHTELWLSAGTNPADKQLLAYHKGWTSSRQWSKYPSQQSAPVALTANQQYYIEALHKEAAGGDNIAVGWQLPDGTMERPIPGNRLSPFGSDNTDLLLLGLQDVKTQDLFSNGNPPLIFPNPTPDGARGFTISGMDYMGGNNEFRIEILNLTGDIIFAEQFSCPEACKDSQVRIDAELNPGLYFIHINSGMTKTTQRLFVK